MAETREEIERTGRAAVLVRRSDLPVPLDHPARSFLGGLPRLPPELVWPKAEVRIGNTEETVALTFVAQIDLAELPEGDWRPLPERGTLFFFCSSMFVGEGNPPCRVFYSATPGDAYPPREPPPDLMRLGGEDDCCLRAFSREEPHTAVEFKYPLNFRPYRDFLSGAGFLSEHSLDAGSLLKLEWLTEALGPPTLATCDLLQFRPFSDWVDDLLWPFNWLLITFMARSVASLAEEPLKRSGKPLGDAHSMAAERIRSDAHDWIEKSRSRAPLSPVDAGTKSSFRSWWIASHPVLDELGVSPLHYRLEDVVNQAIRYALVEDAVDVIPGIYLENLGRRNHFTGPNPAEDLSDYDVSIHQILGNGCGPQDASSEHRRDVLLLQLSGDRGLQSWHSDIGCVLHFWIEPDRLAQRDFSGVVATLECD